MTPGTPPGRVRGIADFAALPPAGVASVRLRTLRLDTLPDVRALTALCRA